MKRLRETFGWIGAALLSLLGLMVGIGWLWRRRSASPESSGAREDVRELQGRRRAIEEALEAEAEEAERLDAVLAERRRAVVDAIGNQSNRTDEEMADAFDRYGF